MTASCCSHFDGEGRVEVRVVPGLAGAPGTVALGVRDQPRAADDEIPRLVRVPVDPDFGAAFLDQRAQIGRICGRADIPLEAAPGGRRMRSHVWYHDVPPIGLAQFARDE